MNRRTLLKTLAGAASVAAVGGHDARTQEPRAPKSDIRAIAFDGFVIFDPRSVEKRVLELVPDKGAEFANLWRSRQFEYTWLRTAGNRYVDFWQVTDDALRYTANSLNVSLSSAQHDALMDSYRNLRPWPDVADGLAELRRRGIRMAFLSNFTSAMLDANLKEAGLSEFFETHMTTDRVRAYKPSPQAYQMGPDGFGLEKNAIAFAAFAPWDAVGAKWFGFPTAWINRGSVQAEQLDAEPDVIPKDLNGLIEFIRKP